MRKPTSSLVFNQKFFCVLPSHLHKLLFLAKMDGMILLDEEVDVCVFLVILSMFSLVIGWFIRFIIQSLTTQVVTS